MCVCVRTRAREKERVRVVKTIYEEAVKRNLEKNYNVQMKKKKRGGNRSNPFALGTARDDGLISEALVC